MFTASELNHDASVLEQSDGGHLQPLLNVGDEIREPLFDLSKSNHLNAAKSIAGLVWSLARMVCSQSEVVGWFARCCCLTRAIVTD